MLRLRVDGFGVHRGQSAQADQRGQQNRAKSHTPFYYPCVANHKYISRKHSTVIPTHIPATIRHSFSVIPEEIRGNPAIYAAPNPPTRPPTCAALSMAKNGRRPNSRP